LHETGFSQAILHPERVAVHNNQFVIMPCVAGVLEPFSKLFSSQKAGWLYYCAPELLRTRAANAELLPQADIFSLGKLFYVLSLPHRKHPYINDPYHFAECLVEQSTTGTLPVDEKIDAESLLTALAVSMCAEAPEERPTLSEIIDRLEIISESVSLESKISRYKNDGKHETALQFIKSLKDDPHTRFFSLPQTTLLLLKADCAVSKASPDFPLAIDQLDKAAAIDPQNFDIQIKIAEVYQKYTDHPQWKQLSAEAYGQAARLSNYRDDIVSSWLDALFLLDKPEKLLLDTASIPPEQRSPGVIARRAACFVKIEKYISAWNESIEYFKKFEPTSEMYELARKAAKNIDSLDLIRWKHQKYDGVKGLEPIVAIVWERNDNLEKARTCFDKNSLT
jgi:serine/threonine protein kinase